MSNRPNIPPATPAPSDLYCWLWAAYPPTANGHLPTSRIAADLHLSARTIRRWLADSHPEQHLTRTRRTYLSRRAILRGKGTYLWPPVDTAAAWRIDRSLDQALYNLTMLNHPDRIPTGWQDKGYLQTHSVLLLHYPRAHVHAVAIASHHKHQARLHRHADILDEQHVPNRWTALTTKFATLQAHRATHCTAPRALVPTGHTEVWRSAPKEQTPTLARLIDIPAFLSGSHPIPQLH